MEMARNGKEWKEEKPKKVFSVRKVHWNTNECLMLLRTTDASYDNRFE